MQICLVAHEYPPERHGGIGTQTWNKARGLTKLGHTVEVVACAAAGQGQALQTSDESGITVHRLRRPGEAPESPVTIYDQACYMLGYTWAVLENLNRLMADRSFDLINFPEYGAEGFAFQVNRTPDNWVPVIVQLHAPLVMLADRIGWPDKDSKFCRTATYMEGESIRLADAWMASSANIADYVADFYQIPEKEIDIVHCGLDCSLFRPPEDGQRKSPRPTVLFVGHVTPSKGIGTVFEAVLQLRHRYPDILLRVVGRGEEFWPTMLSRARRVGAENNLERIPFLTDRREIAELYRQADVFASPADNENGVANVYVEAMASGCPVIVADRGGGPEAVLHGETGFLVPPRDVETVAARIDQLLGDPKLHRRMQLAARRRAEDYFAQEKYIQRVFSAYQRAIERSQEKLERIKAENR
jgi:glycosyltransferase involved in cell wall biosynthesis